ncbi:MAG: hypothetical protein WKF96_13775 [Solirubrobacteraceae bacterium]
MHPQDTPETPELLALRERFADDGGPDRPPRVFLVDWRDMEVLIAPRGMRWMVVLTRGNRGGASCRPRRCTGNARPRGRRAHRRSSPTRAGPDDPPGHPAGAVTGAGSRP